MLTFPLRRCLRGYAALLSVVALVLPQLAVAVTHYPERELDLFLNRCNLVADGTGTVHVAYVSPTDTLGFARFSVAGWGGETAPTVSQPLGMPGFSIGTLPHIVVRADGQPTIFWEKRNADGIEWTTHDGSTWLGPFSLTGSYSNLRVAMTPDGEITVCLSENLGGGKLQVVVAQLSGTSLTLPVPISTPGLDARFPSIAADLDGNLYLCWSEEDGPNRRIVLRRRSAGQWTSAETLYLHDPGITPGETTIAVGTAGEVQVAYPTSKVVATITIREGMNYLRRRNNQWVRSLINKDSFSPYQPHPRITAVNQGAAFTWNESGLVQWYFNLNQGAEDYDAVKLPSSTFVRQAEPVNVTRYGNLLLLGGTSVIGRLMLNAVRLSEADFQPPVIYAGSFDSSRLSNYSRGSLKALAVVGDALGVGNISRVELYYAGVPTGLLLNDDSFHEDFAANDGIWGLVRFLGEGLPPGYHQLEIRATNRQGLVSQPWPALHILGAAAGVPPAPWQTYLLGPGIPPEPTTTQPAIPLAGYLSTRLTTLGGRLDILAWVTDRQNDITEVEMYYGGFPTGLVLKDDGTQGDFAAGDSVYSFGMDLGGELPQTSLLLEMKARDAQGNESFLWPYLPVSKGGTATPTSTPTPTITPTFPPGLIECDAAIPISADTSTTGSTVGLDAIVDFYSCGSNQFRGPEQVYRVNVTGGQGYRVILSDYLPRNLNLLLLRGCSENSCAAVGVLGPDGRKEVLVPQSGLEPYYVVVDGAGDADAGSFRLAVSTTLTPTPLVTPTPGTITPTVPPEDLDCNTVQQIPCDGFFGGDTASGTNRVRSYGVCSGAVSYPGHEKVFRFTMQNSGAFRARINASDRPASLFLLRECNRQNCLTTAEGNLFMPFLEAGSYFLVVDSRQDGSNVFEGEIECP